MHTEHDSDINETNFVINVTESFYNIIKQDSI